MSSDLSKTEYLKRYLENEKDSDRKRKKKAKRKANIPSLKIVDKDIDLKSITFGEKAVEDEDEEAPVVAEVIDERPLEVKMKELYESSRWKKIDNDEDPSKIESPVSYQENRIKQSEKNYVKNAQIISKKSRHDSDSDISPPRIPEKIRKSPDNNSLSPRRSQKRNCDSDISPPRKNKEKRSNRQDSDSDISPPRHLSNKTNLSPKQKFQRHDSDSDISPPRHSMSDKSVSQIKHKSRKSNSDSDISPPRHRTLPNQNSLSRTSTKRYDSDSEDSHPTSKHKSNSASGFKKSKNNSDSDLSPPRSPSDLASGKAKAKKLDKTLSGLKAGLQNSKALQEEIQGLKKREKTHLSMLDDEISGRHAHTIVRDRKTGLKRDLAQEQQVKVEDEKKKKEFQQKYVEWGKGVEQTLDRKEKLKDDIYEMSKPLARYKDDEDLDERLKSIIHDDDPMSEYIKKKRQKDTPKYPVYSGPPAPPNRFGILPGYRWDGVDRSNGFEKKYFEKINKSKAVESEAYLWSVQDM